MIIDVNIFKLDLDTLKKLMRAAKELRARKLEAFFNEEIKSTKIDYLFYQFGLRPKLPLIDVLYLEYLHSLIKKNGIGQIIIFPTIDLSFPDQKQGELTEFEANIKRVFKGDENKISINDPFKKDDIDNEDLTSEEFLKMLRYVGSRKYFNYLKSDFGINVSNISDFNKYHMPDDQLLTIFTHLIRAWQISKYVKNIVKTNQSAKFGFLFWETEVDKLGAVKTLAEDNNLTVSVILGKTIMSSQNKPIPISENALMIFQDNETNFNRIKNYSKDTIKKHILILECILKDNYGQEFKSKELIKEGNRLFKQMNLKTQEVTGSLKYKELAFKLISLVHELRRIYADDTPK